jgi:hypothetical protein
MSSLASSLAVVPLRVAPRRFTTTKRAQNVAPRAIQNPFTPAKKSGVTTKDGKGAVSKTDGKRLSQDDSMKAWP